MKKTLQYSLALLLLTSGGEALLAQAIDWPTFGGDIERSGQGKSEIKLTKDEITKNFKLLWKMQQRSSPSLMAPVVLGRLIGYRGFKELAFFGGTDDSLYVMDADMDRLYWQTKFVPPISAPAPTAECPGGMTAMPSLIPVSVRRSRTKTPVRRFEASFGGPRSIYLISSDGMLRRVNVANGNEAGMPFQIFPANSRISALNIDDGIIYATTSHGCGGAGNGVWAIDLGTPDPSTAPEVTTLMTGPANYAGIGGPAIGKDGEVFVQTLDGPSDPANGKYANALLSLTPKTLAVKGYFIDSSSGPAPKGDLNSVTPVAFEYHEREVIASVSRDGRLNLLDEKSLSADGDHKTPLAQSARIPTSNDGGLWGSLTTWADATQTRYILATVWSNASGRSGSIAAFKLEEKDGKTVFTPIWTMQNLIRPVPPVVIAGSAFVLSSGEGRKNAVLHVVDALTGAPVWSTKNEITAPGNLTPLTVANGRVYLVTADSTVWVFGLPLEL